MSAGPVVILSLFHILVICLSFLDYFARGFLRPTFGFLGFLYFAFIFSISFVHSRMTLWSSVYFGFILWSFYTLEIDTGSWISFQPLFLIHTFKALMRSHLWLHPKSVDRSHFHCHSVQNVSWFKWAYSLTHSLFRNVLPNFPTFG